MAKKFKSRNRLVGLNPSNNEVPATVVRWLGAYGRSYGPIEKMCSWEKKPTREVAAEALYKGEDSKIRAQVGLLLNVQESVISRAYIGDSWTKPNGETLKAKREMEMVEFPSNGELAVMSRLVRERSRKHKNLRHAGKYVEVSVSKPIYSAVVLKHCASKKAKKIAAEIAAYMGLPIVYIG